MKKAKILLSTIVVFAIVGAALAINAQIATFGGIIYTGSAAGECTHIVHAATICNQPPPDIPPTFATTIFDGSGCRLTYTCIQL